MREPKKTKELHVRVTPELHRQLVEGAKQEEVSLNQYILYQLTIRMARVRRKQSTSVEGFEDLFKTEA